MKSFTPIILLATERSGSNLLRAILSSHSAVASPPPAGLVDALARVQPRYFPPDQPPHLLEFVEDAITLTQTHLNPWDIELAPQMIMERMNAGSLWELLRVMNEIYAEHAGCSFWCSKEPGLIKYVYEIREHLPNAKFVYLARDGRDVAISKLRGGVHELNVYSIAQGWASEQMPCLRALNDPLFKDHLFMLKYEDLIENSEAQVRSLMDFIGLEFESSQLEFYKDKNILSHSKKSRFWKNLAKPINTSNKGRYKHGLGMKQIEIFESVAWEEMKLLGYPLESMQRKTITNFDKRMLKRISFFRKMYRKMDPRAEASRRRARNKIVQGIINRKFTN